MDKTCRIGVIGLGQRIAHVLGAMQEVGWPVEVIAHLDPQPVGAPIMQAAGLALGRSATSRSALSSLGPFDLVMIGSPNHLHLEHLEYALSFGGPVFVEKPIVRTEAETLALARRLTGRTPPIFVGLVMRSMSIVKTVLDRVRSGALGQIISIDATEHLHPEHGAYLARNWRRKQVWGGSYLLDKVCHDFDIFSCIAGARAERIASFGGRRIFIEERAQEPRVYSDGSPAFALEDAGWASANDPFQSDMDVADHQVALVEYANQVRLSFHANSHAALQERRWYIAGTKATLIADLVRNRLIVRPALDRGKPERIDFGERTQDNHNGADQAMARDLMAAMQGAAPFPVSAQDSMEAGLTVMAIDQAMRSGSVIDCAPMWSRYDQALTTAPQEAGQR